MKLFTSLPRPAVIAHRGASGDAPENTMPAFNLAIKQGADAIEMDVMLTADGEVVVTHDSRLGRTSNGRGAVGKLNYADLSLLDVGKWFSPEYTGVRMPTLRAVLQEIAPKIPINIEVKNIHSVFDALPKRVADLICETKTEERVFISSFNPIALLRFRRALPDVPIGLLAWGGGIGLSRLVSRWLPYEALHPAAGRVSARVIQRAKNQGLRVHSYTVNEPDKMRDFFSWGIDGIFTDHPALGVRIKAEVFDNAG